MKARSLVLVIASTLLFSGCAESTQRYAANKDVGAYFTVPTKWIKIDAKTMSVDSEKPHIVSLE